MNIFKDIKNLPAFQNAIVTIGSFDGVHKAHQKLIKRINQLADETNGDAVVVTFHPHPRSIVFPNDNTLKLLSTTEEKLSLLKKYGARNVIVVPFTVEFSQISAREYVEKFLLQQLKPSILVVGYDHKFGLARMGDFQMLRMYEREGHFTLIEIEKQEVEEIAISSTNIRNYLEAGDLFSANVLLGGYYSIKGKVIKGDGIGKTIGYPTANILVESNLKLIPPVGIYACYVTVGESKHKGMLYIGNRPTINSAGKLTLEVNIFDFNDNIYEEIIDLEIVEFIRKDEKFNNLEELKNKLDEDLIATNKILIEEDKRNEQLKSIATISILNFNGEEYIESYLPSVLNSSSKSFDIRIIDNKSTDNSVNFIKEWYPEINLVELSKNYGFADGYNKGNKGIISKYTVILNSDVKVTENWLDGIIDLMNDDDSIAAVQPKILSLENPNFFEYAGAAGGFMDGLGYPFCRGRIFDTIEEDENQYEETSEIFWTSGAAMVVRTELFNKFGGFDKDYFAHQEEIDFCWRLKKAGYKLFVYPKSKVYHLGGGTLEYDNPKKTYLNFKNNLITILKNESFPLVIFIFMFRLILDGIAAIRFLLRGKWQNVISILKAHLYTYITLPETVFKRNANRLLIKKYAIGASRLQGKINISIVWAYFAKGHKKFSQLKS